MHEGRRLDDRVVFERHRRQRETLPGQSQQVEERRAGVPMQRYGTSEEIAATVAFLLSDGAGYITGQNILIDGGVFPSAF